MPCPEEYAHSTTKHCDFQGITAGYKSNLLKDQQTKFALQQKKCNNTANRRGPDCFICCGRRNIEGFCEEEVSSIYFPKSGKLSIKSYTNHYSRALSAGSSLLEQSYKGVLLQSQINSEKFLNGNYVVRVYGKTKLTN
jgi:hypothetical protein